MKRLRHESRAFLNGVHVLIKGNPESSFIPPCEDTARIAKYEL